MRCSRRSRKRAKPSADARIEEERTALAQSREERARLEGEIARLEAAIAAQERIIAYRQSIRWWLALPVLRARLLWRRIAGR